MFDVNFAGWFQCRLATDPDPTDEPRGVSGFTFAVAGEPDLDRIIRLQKPVAARSYGPPVGVFVTAVSSQGQAITEHPLLGAEVDLLDSPKFESRNYVIRDGSMGPIVPFRLQLSADNIRICRSDILYPDNPELDLSEIPPRWLARRGALLAMAVDRIKIADATGITDPVAYRDKRQQLLRTELLKSHDEIAQAALNKRIRELDIREAKKLQVATLNLYNDYRFDINGPAQVVDPQEQLGFKPDAAQDWPLVFWMGAWDSDALCGYIRGMLTIK